MKQTAIQLLRETIDYEMKLGTKMVINWDMYLAMEQDQMEVSNEEIEKASYDQATFAPSFIAGAKWYRKQIKK